MGRRLVVRPSRQADVSGGAYLHQGVRHPLVICATSFTLSLQLGQWAASRADLFPTLMCEKLGTLHSRGKQHSLEHTKSVIEHVFQRPFDQVFEEFDDTPIGTGAIAQVQSYLDFIVLYHTLNSLPSRYTEPF